MGSRRIDSATRTTAPDCCSKNRWAGTTTAAQGAKIRPARWVGSRPSRSGPGIEDPQRAVYFRDYFLAGPRDTMSQIWQRALDRKEVRDAVDLDTFVDILAGPLIFRLISGHAPLNHHRADLITDVALRGLLRT
jgi:hypothetical protein